MNQRTVRLVFILLALVICCPESAAQSGIVGWGDRVFDSAIHDEPCVQVAAGAWHTVALRNDGSVVVWGQNLLGQCDVPALPAGLTYVEVAAGNQHTVARRSDGSVVAWGDNQFGQCDVEALPVGLTYVEVAAGREHTVARRSDGSVVGWGDNQFGQCDAPALPGGLTYVEIAARYNHTVARRSDGLVVAWGDNSYGQCDVPALPAGLTYVEVAAGTSHTVARRSDGSAVAWGSNSYGQCDVPVLTAGLTYVEVSAGAASTAMRKSDSSVVAWGYNGWGQCDVPALPAGLTYVELAPAYDHMMARLSDGSVVGWGYNSYGQFNVPVLPVGLTYAEIAAGPYHAVVRRSDGSVVAWGNNQFGQCDTPALPGGETYVEVAANSWRTVLRRSDGSVVAWGYNFYGQCDVPALPAGLAYVEISAGVFHTLARRSDSSVVAWGNNQFGQCDVPALPVGLTYVEVTAGGKHTVARRSDGSVVGWGDNQFGQCDAPALPGGLMYVEIAAGDNHTVARRSDGSVVGWGDNQFGQCDVPVLPVGLTYVEVAAGREHTVARRSDGSVVAWGDNSYGQCDVPALPAGLTYVEVAAGGYRTVARTASAPAGDAPGVPPLEYPCADVGVSIVVPFSWFGASGTTPISYELQLSQQADFSVINYSASGLIATSHTVEAVASTSFWWRVRASNAFGVSAWSGPCWFQTGYPDTVQVVDTFDTGLPSRVPSCPPGSTWSWPAQTLNGLWNAVCWQWNCLLSPENIATANGVLSLNTVPGVEPEGAQLDSAGPGGYGSYRASIRATSGTTPPDGVVNGFFYYYDQHGEIDVEILSKTNGTPGVYSVQFTVHENPNTPGADPETMVVPLPFDPSADFHTYGFDWHPDRVEFFVDPGSDPTPVYTVTSADLTIPSLPGTVSLNNWTTKDCPGGNCFSGSSPSFGTTMEVDWVSYPLSTASTGTWFDLGNALAGSNGYPELVGSGNLTPGSDVALELSSAKPNTVSTLVMGLSPLNAPFKGGVLVPYPDGLFGGLPTDGNGALSLQSTWPAGLPASWSAWWQVWLPDPAGPLGLAASNALRSTTPPPAGGSSGDIVQGYYPHWAVASASHAVAGGITALAHAFAWPSATGDGSLAFPDGANGETSDPSYFLSAGAVDAGHAAGADVLLVLGGWGTSTGFPAVASSASLRAQFVADVASFVLSSGYDGVEVDWEFPSSVQDGIGYVSLVAELRAALGPSRTLQVALPAGQLGPALYFDTSAMLSYVDRFTLMAYDYHTSQWPVANHNAPLHPASCLGNGSVESSVFEWVVFRGVPVDRILLGIPFYGRRFGTDTYCTAFPQGSSSELSFAALSPLLADPDYTQSWDAVAGVPYLTKTVAPSEFISYDDFASIGLKCDAAISWGLDGVAVWECTQDLVDGSHALLPSVVVKIQ